MELRGRTALVTGATGGLGTAIARALAARGAVPVLTGRRTEVLEPLAAETGGHAVAADLADPASVDRLLAEAGDVDVLVANAALPGSGHISSFSVEDIDRALAVNLRAPMVMARRLADPAAARSTRPPSSGCAGSLTGCARTCAVRASASRSCCRASSATRGCSTRRK